MPAQTAEAQPPKRSRRSRPQTASPVPFGGVLVETASLPLGGDPTAADAGHSRTSQRKLSFDDRDPFARIRPKALVYPPLTPPRRMPRYPFASALALGCPRAT